MRAIRSDLLPVVERSLVRFPEYVELLSYTKFASIGHWIEWLTSIQDFPAHFVFRPPCLAIPDVCAQHSFMLVVCIVERLVMMAPPGFEVSGASDILLHLLLPVHL